MLARSRTAPRGTKAAARAEPAFLLVIQFPESYFPSRDDVLAFEARLVASLPRTCDVDGHDVGAGTTNFFVFTDAPLAAHRAFRKYLGTRALEREVRVAYRSTTDDDFVNLWPFRDARPFELHYAPGEDPFRPASKRAIPKRSPAGVSKLVTPAAKRPTSSKRAGLEARVGRATSKRR